jgi:predicted DNA-binding transcriptional regulator AlpA
MRLKDYLPLKAVVEDLGVSRWTLWRAASSGIENFPKPTKVGRQIYWKKSEMDALEAALLRFEGRCAFDRKRKQSNSKRRRLITGGAFRLRWHPNAGIYPHQSGFGVNARAPSCGHAARCPASIPVRPTSRPSTERSIRSLGRSIRSYPWDCVIRTLLGCRVSCSIHSRAAIPRARSASHSAAPTAAPTPPVSGASMSLNRKRTPLMSPLSASSQSIDVIVHSVGGSVSAVSAGTGVAGTSAC